MNKIQQTIQTIIETKTPQKINGVFVDAFTASMINTIANNLTEENRNRLYSMPVNKMVAISVKMLKVPSFTLNESAAEEAKKLGLDYFGFGRYGKNKTVTHLSQNGKLMAVKKQQPSKGNVGVTPYEPKDVEIDEKGQKIIDTVDNLLYKSGIENTHLNKKMSFDKFQKLTGITRNAAKYYVRNVGENESIFIYDDKKDIVYIPDPFGDWNNQFYKSMKESASEDAKRQGLEYFGFGRYGKDGKVTHKMQNGKLTPFQSKFVRPDSHSNNPDASDTKYNNHPDSKKGWGADLTTDTDEESFDSQEDLMKSILSISPEIVRNAQSASLSAKNSGEDGTEVFVSALMNGLDRYALRVGTSREQPMDKKALAAYERLERLYNKVRLRHKEMGWKSNKDER